MYKLAQALAASVVLLAAPAVVRAQPEPATDDPAGPAACAIDASGPARPLQDTVAQQLKNLPACQKNLAWLAWVGQAYNQLGRYPEAAEYLERALLLAPGQLQVQMQYALALAGSGDALASLLLLQDLLAEPGLPAPLRVAVEREIARWTGAHTEVAQWQHRGYLHTRLGHDSNLLGTPNLTSLTLTLPGQSLQLPLDASYLRTPGAYSRVDTGWVASKGPWQWAASAGGRHSATAPAAALQQGQASVEYAAHGGYANATLGLLRSRSGTRYRTLGLMAGLQWSSASPGTATPARTAMALGGNGFGGNAHTCQTRLGPELQNRQLASNPVLSGRYAGFVLQHTCQLQGTAAPGQVLQAWQISARWGADVPRAASQAYPGGAGALDAEGAPPAAEPMLRPGGRQQQASLRLAVLGRGLASRHQWLLDAEALHQADATGYSPLLSSGARRSLNRTALRAEYSLPLPAAPAWQLAVGAEWQRQGANLVLFRQQSHGAYLGLRRQW